MGEDWKSLKTGEKVQGSVIKTHLAETTISPVDILCAACYLVSFVAVWRYLISSVNLLNHQGRPKEHFKRKGEVFYSKYAWFQRLALKCLSVTIIDFLISPLLFFVLFLSGD